MRCFRLAACCGLLVLVGCAQTPKTTAGLNLPLEPSQYPGTLVYRAPGLQVGKYKSILVDSADIYRASDADFGGTSEADKTRLAEKLSTDFTNALTKHKYPLASQAGQGVVRLHLTLAGFVATESPIALDLTSGLGKLRAAELGIERGSEEFAQALDRFLNRNPG